MWLFIQRCFWKDSLLLLFKDLYKIRWSFTTVFLSCDEFFSCMSGKDQENDEYLKTITTTTDFIGSIIINTAWTKHRANNSLACFKHNNGQSNNNNNKKPESLAMKKIVWATNNGAECEMKNLNLSKDFVTHRTLHIYLYTERRGSEEEGGGGWKCCLVLSNFHLLKIKSQHDGEKDWAIIMHYEIQEKKKISHDSFDVVHAIYCIINRTPHKCQSRNVCVCLVWILISFLFFNHSHKVSRCNFMLAHIEQSRWRNVAYECSFSGWLCLVLFVLQHHRHHQQQWRRCRRRHHQRSTNW